jgi:hypothetical protein
MSEYAQLIANCNSGAELLDLIRARDEAMMLEGARLALIAATRVDSPGVDSLLNDPDRLREIVKGRRR